MAAMLALALPVLSQTVTLQETVSVEVAQEEMTARFFVERTGSSLPALNREVGDTLKKAFALSKPQAKIVTKGLQSNPIYNSTGKTDKYTVRAVIELKGTNLDVVSEVSNQLAGFMGFENISFSLSDELRKQTQDALAESVAQAFNAKAQKMAKALGYQRAEIQEITLDSAFQAHQPVQPMAMRSSKAMMAMSDGQVDFQQSSGTERVTSTISGRVRLLP